MDSTGIATTYAATTQAQTSQAIQTEIMKMAAAQEANVVSLLQAGAENLQSTIATPPPGLGNIIDKSA